MKNNRINTVFLVLLNLSLIAGFSFIFFNGGLEKVFNSNSNKYRPVAGYIISIDKSAPSSGQFPRQTSGGSKIKSSAQNSEDDNSIPAASNLESFNGRRIQSNKGTRRLSSYSGAKELMTTDDDQSSSSSSAGGSAIYAGSRKGGAGVSGGTSYTGSVPFTDGISNLPRSSAPKVGGANTILIDPQTDPLERKRIPVGEGLVIMLLFAAAFGIRKAFQSRTL